MEFKNDKWSEPVVLSLGLTFYDTSFNISSILAK